MTPEKIVQNSIIDYLTKLQKEGLPVLVERRNAGGFSYKKGIPDLYAVINGIHLEIEVKRPGGTPTVMQLKYLDKCKARNIPWICADNIDVVEGIVKMFLMHNLSFY